MEWFIQVASRFDESLSSFYTVTCVRKGESGIPLYPSFNSVENFIL